MTDQDNSIEDFVAKVSRESRRMLGPQWDTIYSMIHIVISSEQADIEKLNEKLDVESTLRKLTASHNVLEAAKKDEVVDEQVGHSAMLLHTVAETKGIDQEVAEYACSAIRAVCMRHTIGRNGFTEEDYDILTADWRNVFSPV